MNHLPRSLSTIREVYQEEKPNVRLTDITVELKEQMRE